MEVENERRAVLDNKVDDLIVVTTRLVTLQETTTSNVDKLTRDIKELSEDLKESLCSRTRCENVENRVTNLEALVNDREYQRHEDEINVLNKSVFGKDGRGGILYELEKIKEIPGKILSKFTMTMVSGVAIALLAYLGLK